MSGWALRLDFHNDAGRRWHYNVGHRRIKALAFREIRQAALIIDKCGAGEVTNCVRHNALEGSFSTPNWRWRYRIWRI